MIAYYYVYVLYSLIHGRYYVGSSADPQKRLNSHNDSRNRGWTRRFAPWVIIYTERLNSKYDALKREKWLKSGIGRDFILQNHKKN